MSVAERTLRSVVALSGGVGGARFLHGVARALAPGAMTAIVNTGDDFRHWNLAISPDVDTVMYTLSDLVHEERGWGLADETFHTLERVKRLGGDGWFMLGDRDLATHILRTEALAKGERLTSVTARFCSALGISSRVLPMADAPRRTMIDTTTHGTQSFQDWFVRLRAEPKVRRVWFDGPTEPAPEVLLALRAADLVLVGPSNPYVSVDPILTLDGVRDALSGKCVVAVSPLIGGKAVKGPLATMIPDLDQLEPTSGAIARHYGGLLSGIVVEQGDEAEVTGVPVLATKTLMKQRDDSLRLARETLAFAGALAR